MKLHQTGTKVVVAICDEEILGKEFREGNLVLKIDPSFYGGKLVDLEEAIDAIISADIAVISGKRIVEELAKRGIVIKDFALRVANQLHVQIVREIQ